MSPALFNGTAEHLPDARVTVDWFHIVQTFIKALDEVRKRERRENNYPKAIRWAVLESMDNYNLKEKQLVALRELVADQGAIANAWIIKENLRQIRCAPTVRGAR